MLSIREDEFRQFAAYIKANYGIHFKKEKKTLIEGRLGSLLSSLNLDSLSAYMDYVKADKSGQAAKVMLDKITTNHTFFMREPAHFHYFRETVLPWLRQAALHHDMRIWSAACATGEEAYTLAMLIDEFFGGAKGPWDTTVLATDISQQALDTAKAGIYSEESMGGLSERWKKKYFREQGKDSGQYQISEALRREVVFARLNLMDERFPFKKKMHVIFCRNVMIYFDQGGKERLVNHLYEITEPGGYLFIGHSESLNREKTRFRYVMPAVYRKE